MGSWQEGLRGACDTPDAHGGERSRPTRRIGGKKRRIDGPIVRQVETLPIAIVDRWLLAARKIAEMEMPILVDRHLRSRAAYRQLGRNNRRRRHAARQKQTSQTEPD